MDDVRDTEIRYTKEARSIWYLKIEVSFKKGKSLQKKKTWAVSKCTHPHDIMRYDKKTMKRLENELYGKSYKSAKQIVITKVLEKKYLSESNIAGY